MAGKRVTARPKGGPRIKLPTTPPQSPQTQTPVFALEHMQSPYCVDNLNQAQQAAFAQAMWMRSRMIWLDITLAPRHGLGQEDIARGDLNPSIPKHITDDVDFIALRFWGKAPMVGYRDGRIFHVIWLDHDFSVYKHSP